MTASKPDTKMSSNRNAGKRSSAKGTSSNEQHGRGNVAGDRRTCGKVIKRRLSDSSERQRVSVACARCRKRKIKCSGHHLDGDCCSACTNVGGEVAAQCKFLRVKEQRAENDDAIRDQAAGFYVKWKAEQAEKASKASHRLSRSPAPPSMPTERHFGPATDDTHLAVHAQPPSLSSSPMTIPFDSDESWEASHAWSMEASFPLLPSQYAPNLTYPMACTLPSSTEHMKISQPIISHLNDTTGPPGYSTSLVDMSRMANMSYDMYNDVQAGMYSDVSALNNDAGLYSSNYQSTIPHSCATNSTGSIQAVVPPWQMMQIDESCLHNKLDRANTFAPQTPGAEFARLPVSNAPSSENVQSTRPGSLISFATLPEQSLTTSYDAHEYQPVMSDALSMASYTPVQRFARLALDQSPAQQMTHRRRSVDDQQQHWDYTPMAPHKHEVHSHGLPFIPPISYLSCYL